MLYSDRLIPCLTYCSVIRPSTPHHTMQTQTPPLLFHTITHHCVSPFSFGVRSFVVQWYNGVALYVILHRRCWHSLSLQWRQSFDPSLCVCFPFYIIADDWRGLSALLCCWLILLSSFVLHYLIICDLLCFEPASFICLFYCTVYYYKSIAL